MDAQVSVREIIAFALGFFGWILIRLVPSSHITRLKPILVVFGGSALIGVGVFLLTEVVLYGIGAGVAMTWIVVATNFITSYVIRPWLCRTFPKTFRDVAQPR